MIKDTTEKLDGLASLMQSRGMFRYAYGIDKAADTLEGKLQGTLPAAQQKLVNAYDAVKDKEISHPVFESIREQVDHHFVNDETPSALKDFVGVVTVQNKTELLSFIMEIVKFIHYGRKLSTSDEDFLDTLERICVTS